MTQHRKRQAGQPAGQWAQQQKQDLQRQDKQAVKNQARRVVEGGEEDRESQERKGSKAGDNRTPDQSIGEVAYASRDPARKKTGEF